MPVDAARDRNAIASAGHPQGDPKTRSIRVPSTVRTNAAIHNAAAVEPYTCLSVFLGAVMQSVGISPRAAGAWAANV